MILLFITNIMNETGRTRVMPVLNTLPGIRDWNVDMGDCDHVLRVEAVEDVTMTIISSLAALGFCCRVML